MQPFKQLFLFFVFSIFANGLFAQLRSVGFNAAYENSKYLITDAGDTYFENGRPFNAFYAGMYYKNEPSKGQASKKNWFKPFLSVELGVCRCGGFLNLQRVSPQKEKYLEEFEYLVYRYDLGVLGGLNYGNFNFFAGPELVVPYYKGRKIEDGFGYEDNFREYKDASLGVNLGVGYTFKYFHIDARYQRLLTNYGVYYKDQNLEFKERQLRLTVGAAIIQKNREKNTDSIFWR